MTSWSAAQIAQATGAFAPTAEQTEVIEAPLAPMLVVAGAGSGKTATMAARVVYLLANGLVQPGEILGLTFTRKAASELSERVRLRLREMRAAGATIPTDDRPRIATYNSYAGSIVRDHALRLGLSPDAVHVGDAGRFQMADALVASWAGDIDTSWKRPTLVDGMTALEGEIQEHGVSIGQVRRVFERVIESITALDPPKSKDPAKTAAALRTRSDLLDLVEAFMARKRERGLIDFGEEVRVAAEIAQRAPEVGRGERSRYRVVLLDEYQDTSIAQVQLLRALFGAGHPVTAVGDPNQAIYGWRGAAAGTLFDFPEAFTQADGSPALTATLATAWRNDQRILDAANIVAQPLRNQVSGLVPVLQPRPQVEQGAVAAEYFESAADEAEGIAQFLVRERAGAAGVPPSAAVLCRKRSQFAPIAAALAEHGIPVQVVGIAGLLQTPEVADIWCALIVVDDPGRGDALMRLLTGPAVNLGAADLLALGEWANEQARRQQTAGAAAGGAAAGGAAPLPEPAELASLVEAVDQLPPAQWRDRRGRELSDSARHRLSRLARTLAMLRSVSYLSLPELVSATERALNLDIEVAAARPGPVGEARRNLDEFISVAASFTGDATERNLGAFLAWLDAALDEERGLDTTEPEPDPGAVQVMTVHAAKGLEWDAVVVPGLVEGTFPTTAPTKDGSRRASGWLSGAGSLPYEVRGDAAHLPTLDVQVSTLAELDAQFNDFKIREGARELAEERRLAYVALTRARRSLLLTGCFWRTAQKPGVPSLFLTQLIDAGAVPIGEPWPRQSAFSANPALSQVRSLPWPTAPSAAIQRLADLGAVVPVEDDVSRGWWRDAQILLAERDESLAVGPAPPVHLSASAVVALGSDREAFLRDRRRPIPRRPSVQARRGTQFHAWVERHFGAQALLDTDALPGATDADIGHEGNLDDLISAFLASPWANRVPVAVEADVETPVAGLMIRCRIDAVFDDGDGGFHVVDWKTGPPPTDPADRRARQLQLVLYRLAWSRFAGVELEQVRASFHHVAQGVTIDADDAGPEVVAQVLAGLR